MPEFGERSLNNIASCDERIQRVLNKAIEYTDFAVLCGHRSKDDQNRAFMMGYSKVNYPNSRHNTFPSMAVDIVPYPIDWSDIDRFKELSVIILTVADCMGIELEWGGDWRTFKDYPHYQIKGA